MVKKSVLIVSGVFPPEQVTSALMNYDLAVELAKMYDVTVLRPYPTRPLGTKYENADVEGVDFKVILLDTYTYPQSQPIGRFRESIDFGKKVTRYIKQHHKKIDFIYNCSWQLFGVYLVAKTAKKYGIPYMIAIQDIYPESLLTGHKYPLIVKKGVMSVFGPLDKYYQKNAYKVRTISEEMASYLSETRKIPKEKYLVVNNWQNDEDFSTVTKGKKSNSLVFAYVGSINVHSNVDLIIKAFHRAKIQNATLRIYGGGNRTEQCIALAKELGLTNVTFDQVSRDKVPEVQSEADVLVLALPKGNGELCLPSKITSYMLSGKPILASVDLNSATHRYLTEANCGIVVESDSLDALARAFEKIGNMDADELKEMGRKGKSFADNNLTKKVNLELVVDAIKCCMEKQQ